MFSHKLKQLRLSKDLSQRELGQKVGVSNATLSLYENNDRKPDFDTIKKLADYFGVTADYLLGRTDDPNGTVTESYAPETDVIVLLEDLQQRLLNNELTYNGEKISKRSAKFLSIMLSSAKEPFIMFQTADKNIENSQNK